MSDYLPLPHSPYSPTYAPTYAPTHPGRPPRRRWALPGVSRIGGVGIFLTTAAISGVVFHLFIFSMYNPLSRPPSANELRLRPLIDPDSPLYVKPDSPLLLHTKVVDESRPLPSASATPEPAPSSTPPPAPLNSEELSLEELRELVSHTKGFFSREYSLGLGWNNMRYIIEAALLQSQLLNRTLVLPSFVYARGCEYNITVCADYAPMVNKGDAVGWEEWRKMPMEQQMGWRMPMSLMLNLTHLRERHPVILIADYLRLHGLDPLGEFSNGAWNREAYHKQANVFESDETKLPTLFVIENSWYDPEKTVRVDVLPDAIKARGGWVEGGGDAAKGELVGHWPAPTPTNMSISLAHALGENQALLDWDRAKEVVYATEPQLIWELTGDEQLEAFFQANGWEVVYTFRGALNMDYTKTVTDPLRQITPVHTLRGFKDEFAHVSTDVVILAGETHLGRKPGAMRFTTPEKRTEFASMVVHALVAIDRVLDLGKLLAERMQALAGGRLWMGGHMRRGDFVRLGWAMDSSPLGHVTRVKKHLESGRDILTHMTNLTAYPIQGVTPNLAQLTTPPPLPDDPFYIATDERDPEALRIIGGEGAVFMTDLLTMEDRRNFGWPLMITDIRALVEQVLLSYSAFFYGHGMSSVAGGIMNMRAAHGADPRTMLLD
ncbi:hypothetical protein FA95DRAFT_1174199 [Auriscalpium vulgare]|uniref:Uncharacterized protein n=1 Tax=Auriscalpium vulgare TaxID=40419 RepID=A0ACB8S9M9_9AGAM|nr:hypothetical protein FA95DRAFT_1174199 [Auriscalpium vulgare]